MRTNGIRQTRNAAAILAPNAADSAPKRPKIVPSRCREHTAAHFLNLSFVKCKPRDREGVLWVPKIPTCKESVWDRILELLIFIELYDRFFLEKTHVSWTTTWTECIEKTTLPHPTVRFYSYEFTKYHFREIMRYFSLLNDLSVR
ncbi:uncharacterized protein V1478_011915 [Vespula squamosa]|uniref:Uncharacterized protein n=1 Tax=Vespula squamosa TaxID=30214 RepID=A0ABD2ABR0_VESSQ